MKVFSRWLLASRPTLLLVLLLALGFTACSKDEVMAPGADMRGMQKGDGINGDDQGRIIVPTTIGNVDGTKDPVVSPNGIHRDFEGDGQGEPGDGGISDDGDDEGDNEKSNTKPRAN
ncbi:MAG: hypothetical protein ABI599_08425 [Flavobacteriales bacterium]